jgi:hypothetical protein
MRKLVPLLREGADDLERTLLAAARQDGPPDRSARARTLAALKVASRTGAAVGGGAAGLKGLSLLKPAMTLWHAIGALGIAAMLGGGVLLVRDAAPVRETESPRTSIASPSAHPLAPAIAVPSARRAPPPPSVIAPRAAASPPPPSSPPAAPRPQAPVNPPRPTRGAPPASREALAASPSTEGEGRSSSAPAAPAPIAPSSLRQEAALLESVRESLAASRFDRALGSLDEYDARFAGGALEEEAAVLRVEALLAAGRRDEARRVVADFERGHPASSYAPRMRARVDRQ